MATFDRRKIISSLKKKGFRVEDSSGRHDTLVFDHDEKNDTIRTEVSRGSCYKEIGSNLLGLMKRDLNLSRDQFHGLIRCPVDEDDLILIYKNKGLIPSRKPKVRKEISKDKKEEALEKIENALNDTGVNQDVIPDLSRLHGIIKNGKPSKRHMEELEHILEDID